MNTAKSLMAILLLFLTSYLQTKYLKAKNA